MKKYVALIICILLVDAFTLIPPANASSSDEEKSTQVSAGKEDLGTDNGVAAAGDKQFAGVDSGGLVDKQFPGVDSGGLEGKQVVGLSDRTDVAAATPYDLQDHPISHRDEFGKFISADAEMLKLNCSFELEQLRSHPRMLWFNLLISNLYYEGEFMGMTFNLVENFVFLYHSGRQPIWLQESATISRLAAKTILIGGTFFDLWVERKEKAELRKDGLDIDALDKKMLEFFESCNEARTKLASQTMNLTELHELNVLDDISTLAAVRYIALRKRLAIRQRSEAVERYLTIVSKTEVSLGSDVVRIVAAPTYFNVMNGPASISTTFAGSETLVQGVIAQYFARKKGTSTANYLHARFGALPTYDESWTKFQRDWKEWKTSLSQDVSADKEQLFFSRAEESLKYLEEVNYSLQRRDSAGVKRETQLHVIGFTQGVRGCMSTVAGFIPASKDKKESIPSSSSSKSPPATPQQKFLNFTYALQAGHHNFVAARASKLKEQITLLNAYAAVPYVAGTGIRWFGYGLGRGYKTVVNRKRDREAGEKIKHQLNELMGAIDAAGSNQSTGR